MRSLIPMSLVECFLLCVPIGAIAVWAWGWRTLAIMLLGAIVVGLLIDAALQDEDRVLAFLAQAGLTLIGAAGLVVAGVAAVTIATPLGGAPMVRGLQHKVLRICPTGLSMLRKSCA